MLKKTLNIILIIIIIIVAGIATYWFFDREQTGGAPFGGSDGVSIGDFFPFGNNADSDLAPITQNNSTTTPNNNNVLPAVPPRLWMISTAPQAGSIVFTASGTPTVRFVDKATGNIFESSLTLTGLRRISNTTIPKVYEADWQANGYMTVLRYLGSNNVTIKSITGTVQPAVFSNSTSTPNTDEPQELESNFLPDNISSLSVNPFTGDLVYIVENENGGFVSVASTTKGTIRQIYSSAIRDMRVSWVAGNTIGLLSKPSASIEGQFYFLKSDTGRMERILGGIKGLTTLARFDGTKIAYSESKSTSFSFGLYLTETGEKIIPSFSTLPEKCVWSKITPYIYCAVPSAIQSANYPDAWYKGIVSFNDSIWRLNTTTGETELIVDPGTALGANVDAIDLHLDPNENYLVFTNKKDDSLWGLRIEVGN